MTCGSQVRRKEDLQFLVPTDEGNLVSRTKAAAQADAAELRQVEALPPHFEEDRVAVLVRPPAATELAGAVSALRAAGGGRPASTRELALAAAPDPR